MPPSSSERSAYQYDAPGRRAAMVNALNKVLEVFCSHFDDTFDKVLASALRIIAEAATVDQIHVDLVDPVNAACLKQLYRWDSSDGVARVNSTASFPRSPVLTEWFGDLMQGRYINRQVSDAPKPEAAFMNDIGLKSIFIVPIFTGGALWGCVIFKIIANDLPFYEDCADLTLSFARLCANAVIRDEMAREIAEQSEITRVMFDSAPIGLAMYDENCNLVDCNSSVLEMLDVPKERYLSSFFELAPKYQPGGFKSYDLATKNMKRALDGEKLVMEWMHRSPSGELIPTEVTFTRMFHNEKPIGLCYIYDLRTIKRMERNILKLKSESEKIYYDPLTGIFNRRFFDENLDRVIKTLSRSGGTLSLMMIDIDAFKSYNDTYGHAAGDNCLKIVAESLSKSITRADDFAVRYGGDEFAIVLPNTDEDGTRLLAEKMLENVRSCAMPHEKNNSAGIVTISIGGTTGRVKTTYRADDYIKRADELLYESKQIGRNRATFGRL